MKNDSNGILSSPITIGTRIAPNRIVNQPMECNDADDAGNPTELTFERYRRLAEGRAGVVFVEALGIDRNARARKNQLGIFEETAIGLEKLVGGMKKINSESVIILQITHSGSQNLRNGSDAISVYPTGDSNTHVLTEEEIDRTGDDFAKAAKIAKEVGGDGVDLKHCHGYLGIEMLRPANNRKDRFGGSLEKRTRFLTETVNKIKQALGAGSFLLGARLSVYEGIPGGFGTEGPEEVVENLSEPLAVANLMERMGFDYLNVSAGIPAVTPEITRPTSKYPEGVYRHFGWAKAVKKTVKIPVIGSGYSYLRNGKNELKGEDCEKRSFLYWAEKNLQQGGCDLVGIGRQSLADPHFAEKILSGKSSEVNYCRVCGGCSVLLRSQIQTGCVLYSDHYRKILGEINQRKQRT